MTKAKFSEILDAFEFCSFGDLYSSEAYLSLERGTVHIVSDDEDEDVPEDIETGPYLALPSRSDLRLGPALAIAFAEEFMPGELVRVQDYFRKQGAYGRFKDLLAQKGQLQAWYDYEAAARESGLRQWCADMGIELV